MTIQEIHYQIKRKLNKVDSEKYRNLLVPEIDSLWNEAKEIFVKLIAMPRYKKQIGFETSQRTIDDIRTLVVNATTVPVVGDVMLIPADYRYFLNGYVKVQKGECIKKGRLLIKQHDDLHEESPFDKTSFVFGEINARFFQNGLRIFLEDGMTIIEVCDFAYIKKPTYDHYAAGSNSGQYKLPNGTLLTGIQNPDISEHTHSEIVDIAVFLATQELQIPDYNIKQNKINFLN